MGFLTIVLFIGVIFFFIELANDTSNKPAPKRGDFNYRKYNQDWASGIYTPKQLSRRLDAGVYHDEKK